MTAAELYEIVKDVPREAWPRGVGYSNGLMAFEHAQERMHTVFDDEHAEAMFVGSMTAWLARRGFFPTCNVWDDGKNPRASVLINNQQMSHGGSTLVAALAAACKEAA